MKKSPHKKTFIEFLPEYFNIIPDDMDNIEDGTEKHLTDKQKKKNAEKDEEQKRAENLFKFLNLSNIGNS